MKTCDGLCFWLEREINDMKTQFEVLPLKFLGTFSEFSGKVWNERLSPSPTESYTLYSFKFCVK